jgi:hypothetical protein
MIHNVITSIALKLDEFIKNKLSLTEDTVIVSSLVDIKGNVNQDIENKISVFLLHIEEETITKNATIRNSQGTNPPVKINIMVMFSAYFPNFNYVEALRYVSLVIEFFQNTNVFDDSNTSGLPINANRIHTELHNISIEEIGKLWGNIGANYIPSVSYRFKHILFDGESISQDIPRILGVSKKSFNLLDNVEAADVKNIVDENNNPN